MANIQVRIDDATKSAADSLFYSLGMDTSTAVRMFISSALDNNGLPFEVKKSKPSTIKRGNGKWSKEYIAKVRGFCDDPDPTFIEQPEPHFTDRGELFD
jgi:addiction module RelB/DinJ family antitoxin